MGFSFAINFLEILLKNQNVPTMYLHILAIFQNLNTKKPTFEFLKSRSNSF